MVPQHTHTYKAHAHHDLDALPHLPRAMCITDSAGEFTPTHSPIHTEEARSPTLARSPIASSPGMGVAVWPFLS